MNANEWILIISALTIATTTIITHLRQTAKADAQIAKVEAIEKKADAQIAKAEVIEKKVDHTIDLSNGHYRELLDEIAMLKKARFVLSGTDTDAVEATAAQEKVDRADAIPSLVKPLAAVATPAAAAAVTPTAEEPK